jgi:hypothetical protein
MMSASIVLNFSPKLSIFKYDTWAAGSAALDRFRPYLPDLQPMAIGQARRRRRRHHHHHHRRRRR